MFGRTPIALLALLIATVAIVAACGNPGESVVAQPTPLAPLGEITPITADADAEPGDHDPAPGNGVAAPAKFITTCGICHTVAGTDSGGTIGPELTHIGTVASTRTDLGAEEYIRESIEDPGAFLSPGFGAGMPSGLASTLGADFDVVVAYLVSLE